MSSLIQRRGLTVRRMNFNELTDGKPYLEADGGAGPYVKSDSHHRLSGGGLAEVSSGQRIIDLTEPGLGPGLVRDRNYFSSQMTSQGAICTGTDPILGPPYPPVFYQLFIDQPNTFVSAGGGGSEPAHLYWTMPLLILQVVVNNNANKRRVWFGTVDDIGQANQIDIAAQSANVIHNANYIWCQLWSGSTPPAAPVGGGSLVGTGTGTTGVDFNGTIVCNNVPDNTFAYFALPAISVDHISLRRWRSNSGCNPALAFNDLDPCTDKTNDGIPSQISAGTYTSAAFDTPALNGNIDDGSGSLTVVDSSLVSNGQRVFITTAGLYVVNYAIDPTHVSITSVPSSNNVAAGTHILTGQRVAPIQTADDYSSRDANTNYFYQARIWLTGGQGYYYSFNNVGLIHPYTLNVVRNTNGTNTLSWTGPTAAEVASWPSSAP